MYNLAVPLLKRSRCNHGVTSHIGLSSLCIQSRHDSPTDVRKSTVRTRVQERLLCGFRSLVSSSLFGSSARSITLRSYSNHHGPCNPLSHGMAGEGDRADNGYDYR